jgi:hypothetical protein
MATKVSFPIPQDKIGESFVWRDWFQKLSDRAFGTASTLDVPIQAIYGGTGLTTYNTGDILYSPSSNHLTRLPAPAATSLLQMTAAGVPSWTTAYSTTGTDTTYAYRTNNLSDLASVATARTNLGVTATGSDTTYAYRANNLSDLASASTARTNLGLGSGISTTVDLAKLTVVGTNGSLTVVNGIITAYTAPT